MAGGLSGLGSLFGLGSAGASTNPLGALGGLTSALGSGLGGGQSIGGGNSNDLISQALGWTYGYGDPSGSLTAQEALAAGTDGSGPTALGTAQQYMQQPQSQTDQNAQAQTDTGQPTPAQRAMTQQPAPSLTQAYGGTSPWAPGGSTSPQAAAQGPEAFPQVAGPPTTAGAPPLGTQTPAGGYVPPEKSAVTSYGSPVTGNAISGSYSPDQWQAAKQQMRSMVGAPPPGEVPMPQPRPAAADAQENIPTPQPRPAAADAAPAPTPRAAAPAQASAVPPTGPSINPYTGAATLAPNQGNPIQQFIQSLPPPLQQLAQQFYQQLMGGMGPGMQQQPYGGGHNWAIDPRTGQPLRDRQTGQPLRWDQIPWSKGWDPAQQKQGVPWTHWQNEPPQDPISRSPSKSGSPSAAPPPVIYAPNSPLDPKNRPRKSVGRQPLPPAPDTRDRNIRPPPDPNAPQPPTSAAKIRTSANLPNRSMKDRMTPEEIRRQELDFEKGGMTPQQMRKLRERIKKLNDSRRLVAEVGGPTTGVRRDAPPSELMKRRIYTGPDQPVIGYPPPNTGGIIWGYNQPYFDPATGQMVRPNNDPNRDMGSNWIDPYFRGM